MLTDAQTPFLGTPLVPLKGMSGPKTDVYAVGITLFELLAGGQTPEGVDEDGDQEEVDWSLLDHCSLSAVRTVRALIAREMHERPTCKDALALDWLRPRPRGAAAVPGAADEATAALFLFLLNIVFVYFNFEMQVRSILQALSSLILNLAVFIKNEHEAGAERSAADAPAGAAACSRAVARLRRLGERDFLLRAAMSLFVGQLGRAELEEAHGAFAAVDADMDGILSEEDLKASFRLCGAGAADAEAEGRRALLAADVHGRGCLEFREFAAAYVVLDELPARVVHGVLQKLFVQLCGASSDGLSFASLAGRLRCDAEDDSANIREIISTQI